MSATVAPSAGRVPAGAAGLLAVLVQRGLAPDAIPAAAALIEVLDEPKPTEEANVA